MQKNTGLKMTVGTSKNSNCQHNDVSPMHTVPAFNQPVGYVSRILSCQTDKQDK